MEASGDQVYEEIIQALGPRVPDAEQYQRLAGITLRFPGSSLQHMDPFSAEYADSVLRLYMHIRGGSEVDYRPARDEHAPTNIPPNLFTGVVPWSFKDPRLVSEFLHCWGHILSLLPLAGCRPLRVLEYGPGSGQILLLLARLGIEAYGVDINADAVASIRAQAIAMDLAVQVEQAEFGEGFAGQTFDRILFFESFHHAFDFKRVLARLHERLAPGGELILCGEPVVDTPTSSIPNPWGPRLDGLSAFCIRRFGWMELGFQSSFLRELMRRTGWQATLRRFPGCPRADVWIATRLPLLREGETWSVDCGDTDSQSSLAGADWSDPEGTHRWTVGPDAKVMLPAFETTPFWVAVVLSNLLPIAQTVTIRCGQRSIAIDLPRDTSRRVWLKGCDGTEVHISCATHAISALRPGSNDRRQLGIAVGRVLADACRRDVNPTERRSDDIGDQHGAAP